MVIGIPFAHPKSQERQNNMVTLEPTQQRGWECFRQEAEGKRELGERESPLNLEGTKLGVTSGCWEKSPASWEHP